MTNPEPNIHNELLVHFEAVSNNAKKLGRLETLLEINNLLTTLADASKSVIEVRTLKKVIDRLEQMS
jgi:replication-associated recombination protein RarA